MEQGKDFKAASELSRKAAVLVRADPKLRNARKVEGGGQKVVGCVGDGLRRGGNDLDTQSCSVAVGVNLVGLPVRNRRRCGGDGSAVVRERHKLGRRVDLNLRERPEVKKHLLTADGLLAGSLKVEGEASVCYRAKLRCKELLHFRS